MFDGTARGRRRVPPQAAARPARAVARPAEVILCGGAINSPQLLQLSGVGHAGQLRALGIDVVADLPGVGENLQDHLEVYVQYACKQPVSMAPGAEVAEPAADRRALAVRPQRAGRDQPLRGRRLLRSNDDVGYPNLMFHFLPIAIRYDGSAPAGGHGYQVHIGPMYSDARGIGEDHLDRPAPCTRRCGSTTCPPTTTGGSGSRRSGSPATS